MSNSIVITVPHRLGAKEAKRRIAEQIELLRRNYIDKLAYSEANWNGDTANLRVVTFGQTATAQVYVLDDALRIEVQLPWILGALAGRGQSAALPSSRSYSFSMNLRKNSALEAASCGFFGGRLAPVRRR